MIRARVDLQFPIHGVAHLRLGQHAFHRFFDDARGLRLTDDLHSIGADAPLIAAVRAVDLLVFLAARELDLRRIDDHDVIARVDERGINTFVLALQQPGGQRRDAPEHLALGVDDVPLPLNRGGRWDERAHEFLFQPDLTYAQTKRIKVPSKTVNSNVWFDFRGFRPPA